MRTFQKFALSAVATAAFFMAGAVQAASVEPVLVDPWKSGNAVNECAAVGDYQYSEKIDNWGALMDGVYATFGYDIEISSSSAKTFSWDLIPDGADGAVIVKAGTGAYVYSYLAMTADTGLVAPEGKDISHVTFCWNMIVAGPCDWIGETGWGDGDRYVQQGNWAMYTAAEADGEVSVPFMAGQHFTVGTLTIDCSAGATCDITVALNDDGQWADSRSKRFPDRLENNLMIQGYEIAPTTTPAPGQFMYKARVEPVVTPGISYTMTVPYSPYYGVHAEVERKYCPE